MWGTPSHIISCNCLKEWGSHYSPHYTGGPPDAQKVSCPRSHSKLLARPGLNLLDLMTWCPVLLLYDTKPLEKYKDMTDSLGFPTWSLWGAWGGRLCTVFNTWMVGLSTALILWLALCLCHFMSGRGDRGNTALTTENFLFPWVVFILLFIILSWIEWRSCIFKSYIN